MRSDTIPVASAANYNWLYLRRSATRRAGAARGERDRSRSRTSKLLQVAEHRSQFPIVGERENLESRSAYRRDWEGISMAPADGRDPDQFLKKADRSGHSWTGKSSSRKPSGKCRPRWSKSAGVLGLRLVDMRRRGWSLKRSSR